MDYDAFKDLQGERESVDRSERAGKEADFDEDTVGDEALALGLAIHDLANRPDILGTELAKVLSRDQLSQLINRLNDKIDND